jgi:DNA-binding LacI/PurR family transcriptional regulator
MTKRLALPSAHDVARLAGVSQAAVSRAYTPGASIAELTRTKIFEAAKQLGYRPNLHARSLITGKSGIVGVVMGNPRNTFYLEALDALSIGLAKQGLHLLVFTARGERNTDQLVDSLLQFRVDSLLLMSASLSSELSEQCRANGIPVIYFNRTPEPGHRFPSVTSANHVGAARVAQHLFDQGYRRLAMISGDDRSATTLERHQAFLTKVSELGLPRPIVELGGFGLRAAPAARKLLSSDARPDAIFCTNDMMAMSTIEIARFEFGLEPGRDVGVAGFDNIEGASWLSFDLTTYSQPVAPLIDKTIEVIANPRDFPDDAHFAIEGELVVRASTQRQ